MLRASIILFLATMEVISIYISLFVKDVAITSLERELVELQETPNIFFSKRLLLGIITSTVLSGIMIGIFALFRAVKKEMSNFRIWKLFTWQWIILFIAYMIGLGIDLVYLYKK